MRALMVGLFAMAVLVAPAAAQQWGTDYHMGTFVAFGGDDESGRISVECGDPAAGGIASGVVSVRVVPGKGLEVDKKAKVTMLALTAVGNGPGFPILVERDGDAFMMTGDFDENDRLSLLRLLEVGNVLAINTVSNPSADIATISLAGSSAALEDLRSCMVP